MGDGRENVCPPVAYFSDLILDPRLPSCLSASLRSGHQEKKITSTHRAETENTKHKQEASQFSPEKESRVTAAFQGGAFSLLPPGSNCLLCSLNVLCLRFDEVAVVEEMSAVVFVLVARSVVDEIFPFLR